MKIIQIAPLLLLMLCISPSLAIAEIVKCGGVWTNGSCESAVEQEIKEAPLRSLDPAQATLQRKKGWLHDLTVSRVRAERDYGLRIPVSLVEDECLTAETSMETCRELILQKEREIIELSKLKASELEQKRERSETKTESSGTTTVVNYNNGYDWRDGYWGHKRRPHHDRPGHLPARPGHPDRPGHLSSSNVTAPSSSTSLRAHSRDFAAPIARPALK